MTEWSDAEISRRLALAIGWSESSFYKWSADGRLLIEDAHGWRRFFDYRAPAVIWPIAERFNAFPVWGGSTWFAAVKKDIHPVNRIAVQADTAAKAVALAVIKAKEQT